VLVIVLLVFGINGCLSSRKIQALKDYNRDVAGVVQAANDNTAEFFRELSAGTASANDLAVQINQLRVRAEGETRQARGFSVPGEMADAQNDLVLALGLVQGAIGKVAEKIPDALASDANAAESGVNAIAAEMQAFTAADVVYRSRAAALIQQVLADKQIGGQVIQESKFQQNLGWLDPDTVAKRIGAQAGGSGSSSSLPPAPGRHGHALVSTSVGSQTLVAGGAGNQIPVSGGNVTFDVTFANQGDNIESSVRVRIRISAVGSKTISVQKTVDQTQPGANATVSVPVFPTPPLGVAVKITVEVRKVPGETNLANNSLQYVAIFNRA